MIDGTNGEDGGLEEATRRSGKSESAFRTISEVSSELSVPQHVLRFWETKFSQIRPMKRGGGRRYYRPEDVALLAAIRDLLYNDGYTIKGAQKLLRENGIKSVISHSEAGESQGQERVEREPTFSFETDTVEVQEDPSPALESTPLPMTAEPTVGWLLAPEEESAPAAESAAPVEETPPPLATPVHEPVSAVLSQSVDDVSGGALPQILEDQGEDEAVGGMVGLTDDQRLELEVVLSDLEDLRRILRQAEL